MALQTSGQIALSDIVSEFGGAHSHRVQSPNIDIPAGSRVAHSDYYGASAVPPTLQKQSVRPPWQEHRQKECPGSIYYNWGMADYTKRYWNFNLGEFLGSAFINAHGPTGTVGSHHFTEVWDFPFGTKLSDTPNAITTIPYSDTYGTTDQYHDRPWGKMGNFPVWGHTNDKEFGPIDGYGDTGKYGRCVLYVYTL